MRMSESFSSSRSDRFHPGLFLHELGFDHLHPTEEEKKQLSDIIWSADNIVLRTVGVDIGSSTSHLMFSRVHLQRLSEALSSRFVVVNREMLWRSPILLTPYSSGRTIDAERLGAFISDSYKEAGLTPEDIDSGAVILTGEALKRRNSRAIADLFADQSGKFVCALAGHHLEAVMAAHGSGAVEYSRRHHKTVLNVDIGGGTTKLALAHGGRLLGHAAVAVGGRLVAFDEKLHGIIAIRRNSPGCAERCWSHCLKGSRRESDAALEQAPGVCESALEFHADGLAGASATLAGSSEPHNVVEHARDAVNHPVVHVQQRVQHGAAVVEQRQQVGFDAVGNTVVVTVDVERVDGADRGYLAWGIMDYRRTA